MVASRSAHKVQEIRSLLAGVPHLEVLGLEEIGVDHTPQEEVLEPFHSFHENALSKAEYFHGLTGLPTVADDSGIEVDALGGAPGVRSKRFAPSTDDENQDRSNNAYLLEKLIGKPEAERGARYVCVAALVRQEDPEPRYFEGTVSGRILEAPQGNGGFGYDPLFYLPTLGMTFAEVDEATKNRLSHRGEAFRSLRSYLEGL